MELYGIWKGMDTTETKTGNVYKIISSNSTAQLCSDRMVHTVEFINSLGQVDEALASCFALIIKKNKDSQR